MNFVVASFGPLGTPEMLIIAILVLFFFGAKKIPTLTRSLGRSMGEFRRAKEKFERELMRSMNPRLKERDLPSREDFDAAEGLIRRAFGRRRLRRGRNWIVVLMLIISATLLVIGLLRSLGQ